MVYMKLKFIKPDTSCLVRRSTFIENNKICVVYLSSNKFPLIAEANMTYEIRLLRNPICAASILNARTDATSVPAPAFAYCNINSKLSTLFIIYARQVNNEPVFARPFLLQLLPREIYGSFSEP